MSQRKLTDAACKVIIKELARKLGVDAKLIVTRLLSEDDKNDIRNGELPIAALECGIKLWIKAGCPDQVSIPEDEDTEVEIY